MYWNYGDSCANPSVVWRVVVNGGFEKAKFSLWSAGLENDFGFIRPNVCCHREDAVLASTRL